jgi:dihydroorotate dehydrogenase (fumarate)
MGLRLQTQYMGLSLRSPLIVSACTLSEKVDNIRRMEDAGAGAVVLFSLFAEQLTNAMHQNAFSQPMQFSPEAAGYFPDLDAYKMGPEKYLELIRQAKEVVDIPVIASLNGITAAGWIDHARKMEEAGADGIELNIYYIPVDMDIDGQDVEARYADIVRHVSASVSIPVAVKLNPYFSAMGAIARNLENAGAKALVLFNRFYQPDIDIENLRVSSEISMSSAEEIRLPLLWISFLSGRVNVSLAATTGVQSGTEIIKYILAGSDVVMTASALYRHGIKHLEVMTSELKQWMEYMGFPSVNAFRGAMNQQNVTDPSAFGRANYIRVMESSALLKENTSIDDAFSV